MYLKSIEFIAKYQPEIHTYVLLVHGYVKLAMLFLGGN